MSKLNVLYGAYNGAVCI